MRFEDRANGMQDGGRRRGNQQRGERTVIEMEPLDQRPALHEREQNLLLDADVPQQSFPKLRIISLLQRRIESFVIAG